MPDKYRTWMERYINVDDSSVERHIEYALFLMQKSAVPRAVYVLERTKMINPSYTDVRVLLGKCYLILKRPESALEEYRNAFAADPENKNIREDLIKVLSFLGKNKEADELENKN